MNFFSDPALRARQTQLDAQWSGLWGTYNSTCDNGLGGAFPEFASDYNGWREFYASGSDYTGASKHATDEWQTKAQEWAKRLKDYGCGQKEFGDLGLPGVKDSPPDEPGWFDRLKGAAEEAALFSGLGLTVTLLILGATFIGIVYYLSKSKVSVGA